MAKVSVRAVESRSLTYTEGRFMEDSEATKAALLRGWSGDVEAINHIVVMDCFVGRGRGLTREWIRQRCIDRIIL